MGYHVHCGDAVEWGRQYDGPRFHGLLCDPPYHLGSGGFMNEAWDKGDLAFDPETWSTFRGLLLPGAMILVFAGSYNSHRVATAIEQAGFTVYPQLVWVYAQGMGLGRRYEDIKTHRHGKQALKPAHEPIICAQNPPDGGTLASTMYAYGTGGLNIDGSVIGSEMRVNRPAGNKPGGNAYMMSRHGMPQDAEPQPAVGRYPSNVLFTEPAVDLVASLADRDIKNYYEILPWWGVTSMNLSIASSVFYSPKVGRAERDAGLSDMEETNVGVYMARRHGSMEGPIPVGKNSHPTVKPRALTSWLANLIIPPPSVGERRLFNPFSGSGSELIGAIQAGWDTVQGVELNDHYVNITVGRALGLASAIVERN